MRTARLRASVYTDRCTIERASGADDDWGTPGPPTWAAHLTDQPCRLSQTAGHEQVNDQTAVAVVKEMRLLLPFDTDVTEQDRVASVTQRGAPVFTEPVQIRAVLRHPSHLELVLVGVS